MMFMRRFFIIFIIFFAIPFFSHAATKYWIGVNNGDFGETGNWSLSSGGPANTTGPDSTDVAVFDSGGTNNCVIGYGANVAGFQITSGYTGLIRVSSTIPSNPITVTVGSTGFTQSGGAINFGLSKLSCVFSS